MKNNYVLVYLTLLIFTKSYSDWPGAISANILFIPVSCTSPLFQYLWPMLSDLHKTQAA